MNHRIIFSLCAFFSFVAVAQAQPSPADTPANTTAVVEGDVGGDETGADGESAAPQPGSTAPEAPQPTGERQKTPTKPAVSGPVVGTPSPAKTGASTGTNPAPTPAPGPTAAPAPTTAVAQPPAATGPQKGFREWLQPLIPTKEDWIQQISLDLSIGIGPHIDRGFTAQGVAEFMGFVDLAVLNQCKISPTGSCVQLLLGPALGLGGYLESTTVFFQLHPLTGGVRAYLGDKRALVLTAHGSITGFRFTNIADTDVQLTNKSISSSVFYMNPQERIIFAPLLQMGVGLNLGAFFPNSPKIKYLSLALNLKFQPAPGSALLGRLGMGADITPSAGVVYNF